ncbi:MAG: purine-nucleoside phosphorylase [Chitinophagaceae bacterium]
MSLHIAAEKGAIAPVVLMPGDPLRARYLAENYLEDAQLVNQVRNVFFYTGFYQGKRVSVGASGMGCPSIGIYSYELYAFHGVEHILRIGTCGAYSTELQVGELLLAEAACSESTYAREAFAYPEQRMMPQGALTDGVRQTATQLNMPLKVSPIHSSDVFYRATPGTPSLAAAEGCLAVEMESFALFANARYLGKSAACLLTVSDVIPTGEAMDAQAREQALKPMMVLGLESAARYV